jgi:hypothetical protein
MRATHNLSINSAQLVNLDAKQGQSQEVIFLNVRRTAVLNFQNLFEFQKKSVEISHSYGAYAPAPSPHLCPNANPPHTLA